MSNRMIGYIVQLKSRDVPIWDCSGRVAAVVACVVVAESSIVNVYCVADVVAAGSVHEQIAHVVGHGAAFTECIAVADEDAEVGGDC
jgi:hypothetical protein